MSIIHSWKTQKAGQKPYVIPSRPESLVSIVELMKAQEPNTEQIAAILRKDVYLYSSVLAAVNAPVFALNHKITDINHAITLLGLDRLFSIVRLAALKNSLSTTERLDRFWDSATEVAEICTSIAVKYTGLDIHTAYSTGMMHDCGVPLMLENHPDFKAFLRKANAQDLLSLQDEEQKHFNSNHFQVGAEIAHLWYMPDSICEAIAYQPTVTAVLEGRLPCSDEGKLLLSVLTLAKDISTVYRRFWRIYDSSEPVPQLSVVLEYIGLPDIEYLDLREDFISLLESREND